MFKMRIKMDEEKILKEGKYDVKLMYAYFDELIAKNSLIKECIDPDGTIHYCGTESSDDFGRFGIVTINLWKQPWFAINCAEWMFGDDEQIPGVWDEEDMLEGMRKRGKL